MAQNNEPVLSLMGLMFRAHPWHGVDVGSEAPAIVNAYIEMVPTDTVKYELDKESGLLKVDRPQRFSSMPPMLYGFIPRTYSGASSAEFCNQKTKRSDIKGDGDPLDICVLTERPITKSNILVPAVIIGGIRMIDNNEADDKLVAYLRNDIIFQKWKDISDVPAPLIERLRHYFLTYKDIPGSEKHQAEIAGIYNKEEAYEVIRRGRLDYDSKFAGIKEALNAAFHKA